MNGSHWSFLPETTKIADIAIRVGLTIAIAFILQRLAFLAIARLERLLAHGAHDPRHGLARAKTLSEILRSSVTFLVLAGAVIHSLAILGWDVRPLLAGAGVLGIAVGFGAQTLVRDIISGVFILVEDQYSVGDVIEIAGRAATVETITVRVTMLRDVNGYVSFVPNGEMRVVTNRSRDWNRLFVDVVVRAGVDVDRALAECRRVVHEFNADPQWRARLLDPAEVWGVESIAGAEATVRCVIRAHPGSSGAIAARELRRRLYVALQERGIETLADHPAPPTPTGPPSASLPPATETPGDPPPEQPGGAPPPPPAGAKPPGSA